jgi:formate-dependent phosphoribosylglycinamide formyltransferase (GAR transformylase)
LSQKRILIPGGKLSDWALVNAAHKLGLYVITSGTDKKAPAHAFADEYVCADYSDKEAMLRLAEEKKIDYMCSSANDYAMLSTAYVCEKLGLPGHDSYETTLTIHTKDKFKPIAKRLGLHSPVSEVFEDRSEAIEFLRSAGRKMIVKPADNVASNGVSVPTTEEENIESVDFAFSKSKNGRIIIEPFIKGFFVPVTSMIIEQEVKAFFTEAYFEYPQGVKIAPEFPINYRSTGYQIPSPYADEFSPAIISDFNKIARELKLVDGKFHCELLITPEHEAYIFDVHRRMSGFFNPWAQWDISGELTWEDWIVRAECGMDLSAFPVGIRQEKHIHCRNIFAPRNGIIKRIVFDEYLTSHIYPFFTGKNLILHNMYVTDHLHNPIIESYPSVGRCPLQFAFDSAEEAERISNPANDEFYSHIRFEYVNEINE